MRFGGGRVMSEPIGLPWTPKRDSEVALNDLLGWLLRLHPAMARTLAREAGLRMDGRRPCTTTIRAGHGEDGFPDLRIDGQATDGEPMRLIVELKTRRGTGYTAEEWSGYPGQRKGVLARNVAMLVVGPVGYGHKHGVPKRAAFKPLSWLREVLAAAAPDETAGAVLRDAWQHFRGRLVRLAELDEILNSDDYEGLKRFLRELTERVRKTRKRLRVGNLDGPRVYEPWRHGFYVRHTRADRAVAWMGFVETTDEQPARFIVDCRHASSCEAAIAPLVKRGHGSTCSSDGWAAGTWPADHLGDVLTPTALWEGGLRRLTKRLNRQKHFE
jgi:hypothetical protein